MTSRNALELESRIIAERGELEQAYAAQLEKWVNTSRHTVYQLSSIQESREICHSIKLLLDEGIGTARQHNEVGERLIAKSGPVDTLNSFKMRFNGDTNASRSYGILAKQPTTFLNVMRNGNLREFRNVLDTYTDVLGECVRAMDEMEMHQKKFDKLKDTYATVARQRDEMLLKMDRTALFKRQLKSVETQLRSVGGKMDVIESHMQFHGRKSAKLLQQSLVKLEEDLNQVGSFEQRRLSTVKGEVSVALGIIGALGAKGLELCEEASKALKKNQDPNRFKQWVDKNQMIKHTRIKVLTLSQLQLDGADSDDICADPAIVHDTDDLIIKPPIDSVSVSRDGAGTSSNPVSQVSDSSIRTPSPNVEMPVNEARPHEKESSSKKHRHHHRRNQRHRTLSNENLNNELQNVPSEMLTNNNCCAEEMTPKEKRVKSHESRYKSPEPIAHQNSNCLPSTTRSDAPNTASKKPTPRAGIESLFLVPNPPAKSDNSQQSSSSMTSGHPVVQEHLRPDDAGEEEALSPAIMEHLKKLSNAINSTVVVERNYTAQGPDQLSLTKGEHLRLRKCEAGDLFGWGWKCPSANRRGAPKEQGMFPLTYVTLLP